MTNIFEEFDNAFLNDNLLNEIETAEQGGDVEYKEVPEGRYEVKIQKMELTQSKKGDPMFSCWFKVVQGEYEKGLIFMNQLLTKGFHIHIVNKFLKSLKPNREVTFVSFKQYGELIQDVLNDITGKYEYGLEYKKNAKGFAEYDIFTVFDTDGNTPF